MTKNNADAPNSLKDNQIPTLIRCPACQYTRKPTDEGPDWSCPQCQKAYAKTGKQKPGFCKKHPSVMSNWRCNDCGAEFCEECVKTQRYSGSPPFASCPECKGLCFDIRAAEKVANEEREKNKLWKKGEFASVCAVLAVTALLSCFVYYSGYKRGKAAAKREVPYVTWYRYTVLDPEDDPPVKDLPVVHTTGGSKLRVKGYVAGHNAFVKEWLAHNQFVLPPPVTKASDLDRYRHR